jgi:hypothetical protein
MLRTRQVASTRRPSLRELKNILVYLQSLKTVTNPAVTAEALAMTSWTRKAVMILPLVNLRTFKEIY